MEKRLDYTKYKITACMKRPICATVRKSIANMLKLKGFQKGQSSVRIIHTSKRLCEGSYLISFATTVKISCVTPPETKMLGR